MKLIFLESSQQELSKNEFFKLILDKYLRSYGNMKIILPPFEMGS